MTIEAIKQRQEAARKPRNRNRRKPKPLRNVALLVLALTLAGSAYLIHVGESSEELWTRDETRNAAPSLEIRP